MATSHPVALVTDVPPLAGIHHLKLPVAELQRSLAWYQSRLGYEVVMEFVEEGVLMGVESTSDRRAALGFRQAHNRQGRDDGRAAERPGRGWRPTSVNVMYNVMYAAYEHLPR